MEKSHNTTETARNTMKLAQHNENKPQHNKISTTQRKQAQGSYGVWKSMEKYGIWFKYFPGLEKYGKKKAEYGKVFVFRYLLCHQPILWCGCLVSTKYALKRPKALKYGILP